MSTFIQTIRIFGSLAFVQIVGWGAGSSLVAVCNGDIGKAYGLSHTSVFSGPTWMMAMMGLASPFMGRFFSHYDTRRIMAAGALVMASGLLVLSVGAGALAYIGSWIVLGLGGAALLSTAAYIYLHDHAPERAKRSIGGLMLMTGLSGTVFLPLTAVLSGFVGWRGAAGLYAVTLACVCVPLCLVVLPQTQPGRSPKQKAETGTVAGPSDRLLTLLIAGVTVFNGFVTMGFSLVLVSVFVAMGLEPTNAIGIASFIGILQVSARALDYVGGKAWDGLTTGLVATLVMIFGFVVLIAGQGREFALWGFIVLFAVGSGAMAVSRATLPLVFFEKQAFAKASARIALPQNLVFAFGPPAFAWILQAYGYQKVMMVALASVSIAMALLLALAVLKKRTGLAR